MQTVSDITAICNWLGKDKTFLTLRYCLHISRSPWFAPENREAKSDGIRKGNDGLLKSVVVHKEFDML